MEKLIQFSSILIVLNVVHQVVSVLQVHKRVIIAQRIFMFVVQCGSILLCISDRMASVVDNLNGISLATSIFDALTVIDDPIDVKLTQINQFRCINDNDSNVSMIVIGICQTGDG